MEVNFLKEKLKKSNKINETLKENFQTAVIRLQEELENSVLKKNLLIQNNKNEMENQQRDLAELKVRCFLSKLRKSNELLNLIFDNEILKVLFK